MASRRRRSPRPPKVDAGTTPAPAVEPAEASEDQAPTSPEATSATTSSPKRRRSAAAKRAAALPEQSLATPEPAGPSIEEAVPPAAERVAPASQAPPPGPSPAVAPLGSAPPGWAAPAWDVERPASPSKTQRGPAMLAAVAVVWVAIVALLFASQSLRPTSDAASPSRDPGFSSAVAGTVSIEETFDDLPMDSTLAAPWTIDGDGPVRIAAMPTSVDRSISIGSDSSGDATAVCRPTGVGPGAALRIAFDYRLGRPPARDAPLVELRAGSTTTAELAIDAATGRIEGTGAGAVAGSAAAPSPVGEADPTSWRRVTLTLSDTGILTWEAHETSGGDAGSGTVSAAAAARVDTVCVLSPAGSPAGWVAVDDLVIEG